MWPFKRKQQPKPSSNKKMPKEVQQYYKSEQRERVGLAWLIAFASLILTVLIVLGLFYGGRWAWRKVANNDDNENVSTTQTKSPSESSVPNESNKSESGSSSNGNNPSSSSSGSNDSNTNGSKSSGSTSGSNSSSSQNLSNTGPGNIAGAFVVAVVFGTILHNVYSRRKLQKSFVKN